MFYNDAYEKNMFLIKYLKVFLNETKNILKYIY